MIPVITLGLKWRARKVAAYVKSTAVGEKSLTFKPLDVARPSSCLLLYFNFDFPFQIFYYLAIYKNPFINDFTA
jgi:hypothetical protein